MRILQVSDFRLGNRNYSKEIISSTGVDLLDLDRRAGFDRAVGCALEHDVDVLLVAGGLLDDRNDDLSKYKLWLNERFEQLRAAQIVPVVLDLEQKLTDLDVLRLTDESVINAGGVHFLTLKNALAQAPLSGDIPTVAVAWGPLKNHASSSTPSIDREGITQASSLCSYVALGGELLCQPLTQNAYYCGAACALYSYHSGNPGGLIVEIGKSSQRVLNLIHVRWDGRRRISVEIDAGGMGAAMLADALHAHLNETCMSVDAHTPIDKDHPLAVLYGDCADPNGVGWWSRPIVEVKVRHAECSLFDVKQARPMIRQILETGDHLMIRFKWDHSSRGRERIQPFTPLRKIG